MYSVFGKVNPYAYFLSIFFHQEFPSSSPLVNNGIKTFLGSIFTKVAFAATFCVFHDFHQKPFGRQTFGQLTQQEIERLVNQY